jgi:hypothetical protein
MHFHNPSSCTNGNKVTIPIVPIKEPVILRVAATVQGAREIRLEGYSDINMVQGSVSNGTGQCNFSGQKFLHCPRTKGQQDKLKILPRDGKDWNSLSKSSTGHGTGQNFDSCPVPSRRTKEDRAEKDILKQQKDILKQRRTI